MKRLSIIVLFVLLLVPLWPLGAGVAPSDGALIVNRIRFYPVPGHEQDMLGGKFSGSNTSTTEGFTVLTQIDAVPLPNQWSELSFENTTPYRYLRYEAPPGSHNRFVDIKYYADQQELKGRRFPPLWNKVRGHGATDFYYESVEPDGQFPGLDVGDLATGKKPVLTPLPKELSSPVQVTLKSATSGTTIRYTLDGTIPSAGNGLTYSAPISVEHVTVLQAVTLEEARAPSPISGGIYTITADPPLQPELDTLHVGCGYTGSIKELPKYLSTINYRHHLQMLGLGDANTLALWKYATGAGKEEWEKELAACTKLDDFTVQPFDYNVEEEIANDLNFFHAVRERFPSVQPWLYVQWVGKQLANKQWDSPAACGKVPSAEMSQLYPALTWEEAMGAMLLYDEDLQRQIVEKDATAPLPRVLPIALVMGRIHHLIDSGQFPGVKPGSFYPWIVWDQDHASVNGCYLVDLACFAAFYKRPPTGILPIGTELTTEQAVAMQQLTWDVIQNYPDCGLYQEGSTPVENPQFSPEPGPISEVKQVTLNSATPGAWFRYTLDGTIPTRTRGYVYCGIVSVRPGMTLKAIAYRSGMADDSVSEASYPKLQ